MWTQIDQYIYNSYYGIGLPKLTLPAIAKTLLRDYDSVKFSLEKANRALLKNWYLVEMKFNPEEPKKIEVYKRGRFKLSKVYY